MRAFIKFNKGMLKMPVHWQLWLFLLITANLLIPLFFLARVEARVVVAVLAASMTLTTVLTGRYGCVSTVESRAALRLTQPKGGTSNAFCGAQPRRSDH